MNVKRTTAGAAEGESIRIRQQQELFRNGDAASTPSACSTSTSKNNRKGKKGRKQSSNNNNISTMIRERQLDRSGMMVSPDINIESLSGSPANTRGGSETAPGEESTTMALPPVVTPTASTGPIAASSRRANGCTRLVFETPQKTPPPNSNSTHAQKNSIQNSSAAAASSINTQTRVHPLPYSPLTPNTTHYMTSYSPFKSSMQILDENLASIMKMENGLERRIDGLKGRLYCEEEEDANQQMHGVYSSSPTLVVNKTPDARKNRYGRQRSASFDGGSTCATVDETFDGSVSTMSSELKSLSLTEDTQRKQSPLHCVNHYHSFTSTPRDKMSHELPKSSSSHDRVTKSSSASDYSATFDNAVSKTPATNSSKPLNQFRHTQHFRQDFYPAGHITPLAPKQLYQSCIDETGLTQSEVLPKGEVEGVEVNSEALLAVTFEESACHLCSSHAIALEKLKAELQSSAAEEIKQVREQNLVDIELVRSEMEASLVLALEEQALELSTSHSIALENMKTELQTLSTTEIKRIQSEAEKQRIEDIERIRSEMEASLSLALEEQALELSKSHTIALEDLRAELLNSSATEIEHIQSEAEKQQQNKVASIMTEAKASSALALEEQAQKSSDSLDVALEDQRAERISSSPSEIEPIYNEAERQRLEYVERVRREIDDLVRSYWIL